MGIHTIKDHRHTGMVGVLGSPFQGQNAFITIDIGALCIFMAITAMIELGITALFESIINIGRKRQLIAVAVIGLGPALPVGILRETINGKLGPGNTVML